MRIHDYLGYWADTDPERLCASDGVRSFTYRQMDDWSDGVTAALVSLGVGDDDRVGVLAHNCAEWVALYYGAFKAGVVPVPLNFRLHPREWIHQLNDSGAKAIVTQAQFVDHVEGIRTELAPEVENFIAIDEPHEGWVHLEDLLDRTQPAVRPERAVAADHDLWQMYTSGTTGRPKGAVLTHAAVDANATQIRAAFSIQPGDNLLLVMPLFHAGAAMSMVLAIGAGASMRIMTEFDPTACVRILDEEAVTCATFVPAMIQAMLTQGPDVGERNYPHLRTIAYGASAIAEDTLRQAMETFRCDFVQVFGQTESSAGLTALGPEAHRRAVAGEAHLLLSCGRPLLGTEIAVVDADDQPAKAGEVGEIIARGPQIMRGYWNLPDATAAALAGGWLHTGDAGRFDEEGFLYICDRLKDMIVSGGENIYSREIEDVLHRIPGVVEAAVIGVPDDRWGETVKAIVVARPGEELTEETVIGRCREHLAGYKTPRSVDFIDALPRNASGKVLKTLLRALGVADDRS